MTKDDTAPSCDLRVGEKNVFIPLGNPRSGCAVMAAGVIRRVFTVREARRTSNEVNIHVFVPSANMTVMTHSRHVMKVGSRDLE